MTTHATAADDCRPRSATVFPDHARTGKAKPGFGPAQDAETKPSDVDRRLSSWATLLREAARRRLLIRLAEAQRRHKATSSIRSALAAATVEAMT